MKQDKQAGGLAGIYQATSRGFGFLVPEDGLSLIHISEPTRH